MYLTHFQLESKPFQITSDPKFLWLGEKHKEALATLRYGIMDNRGFLLLTGEVGTGKTILINRLITMLDLDTVVATLPDPDLVSMDFYNLLADGFKMNRTFDSKGAFLIHLRDFLHQSYADHKQVLLVIDESQRLNHHLMEDIRVLSNIELHDRKLINIFFVGQQEFNSLLAAPQNRALAQRITVRYHIAPLEKDEIGQYIHHRLSVAGSKQKIFTDNAIEEVFQFSGGIPRLVNIICDHALLTGYARGTKRVDAQIIKECAEELRIPIKKSAVDEKGRNRAPDSQSIASAVVKAEGKTRPEKEKQQNSSGPHLSENNKPEEPAVRSPVLKVFYAAIVFCLVALAAYAITNLTSKDTPRYDAEDLTPKKYKNSLEKEKAQLAKRLENDALTAAVPPVAQTDSKNEQPMQSDLPEAKEGIESGNIVVRKIREPSSAGSPENAAPAQESSQTTKSGPGAIAIEPLPLMKEKVTIYFTINSNEIASQSYRMLDGVAAYLVDHPEQMVYVRGFTDSSGSQGYNESVSRFRASAVKSYLIGKGASAEKIKIFAMGDAFPVASNATPEGRTQNRRVEIEFVAGQVSGK